jgi:hypothetical protein
MALRAETPAPINTTGRAKDHSIWRSVMWSPDRSTIGLMRAFRHGGTRRRGRLCGRRRGALRWYTLAPPLSSGDR